MYKVEANFGGEEIVSSVEEAVKFIEGVCMDSNIDKEMQAEACGYHYFEFKGGKDPRAFATRVHQELTAEWNDVDLEEGTTFPTISIKNHEAYWDFAGMADYEVKEWLEESNYFNDKPYNFELLAEAFADFPPFLQGEFLDHQRVHEHMERYEELEWLVRKRKQS